MGLEVAADAVALVEDGLGVVRVGVGVDEDGKSVGVVAEAAEVPPDPLVGDEDVRPQHRLGLEGGDDALRALEELRPRRHEGRLRSRGRVNKAARD